MTNTFDNEASPAMLADAGITCRDWGICCLVAAVVMFVVVLAFELGRYVGLAEATGEVQQIERK